MRSMTGFGHAEVEREGILVSVDLRSYNNRFLEIAVSLPSYLSTVEAEVRSYLTARMERGKVEVSIRVSEYEEPTEIVVDEPLARSYMKALESLAGIAGTRERPHLSHLIRMEGILKLRKDRTGERYWTLIRDLLAQAFGQLDAARLGEGEHTAEDMSNHLKILEEEAERMRSLAPLLEQRIAGNLRARLSELVGNRFDESRLLEETAQMLVRFDVNEELARMGAHLAGFREAYASSGACGRRLDFICQELHREINTLGSKNTLMEGDQAVLRMKEALERLREQVRNVE